MCIPVLDKKKRAVSLKTIRQIQNLDLSTNPLMDNARDIFMFSVLHPELSSIVHGNTEKERSAEWRSVLSQNIKPTNNCCIK